jgi:hypothetical protein
MFRQMRPHRLKMRVIVRGLDDLLVEMTGLTPDDLPTLIGLNRTAASHTR